MVQPSGALDTEISTLIGSRRVDAPITAETVTEPLFVISNTNVLLSFDTINVLEICVMNNKYSLSDLDFTSVYTKNAENISQCFMIT